MKKTVIVCEFNPFHNGHRYIIDKAKEADPSASVFCLMSQNFTQRGGVAVLDAHNRACHAVMAGADAVLALPEVFSVAPAEIFAEGAAKYVTAIPDVENVVFGCECGNIDLIYEAADITSSDAFGKKLREIMRTGVGYQHAFESAYISLGGKENVLNRSNNILAVEYVRALKAADYKGGFIAVERVGANHNESRSDSDSFCSSAQIRHYLPSAYDGRNSNVPDAAAHDAKECPSSCHIPDYVPDFTLNDLADAEDLTPNLRMAEKIAVLRDGPKSLRGIYGCTEGLENAIYGDYVDGYDPIEGLCGKRYSRTRIERILCSHLLGIYKEDVETFLRSDLYVKPLAVRHNKEREIFADLSRSEFPMLIRARDMNKLSTEAMKCLSTDLSSVSIYDAIGGKTEKYLTVYTVDENTDDADQSN